MNKKLMIIGAILLCAIIFIAVELLFFKASSPDRTVLKFANEMNKHCPLMIDFETRLDKVSALADNTLHFNYTLIYHDKDSIPVNWDRQHEDLLITSLLHLSNLNNCF